MGKAAACSRESRGPAFIFCVSRLAAVTFERPTLRDLIRFTEIQGARRRRAGITWSFELPLMPSRRVGVLLLLLPVLYVSCIKQTYKAIPRPGASSHFILPVFPRLSVCVVLYTWRARVWIHNSFLLVLGICIYSRAARRPRAHALFRECCKLFLMAGVLGKYLCCGLFRGSAPLCR